MDGWADGLNGLRPIRAGDGKDGASAVAMLQLQCRSLALRSFSQLLAELAASVGHGLLQGSRRSLLEYFWGCPNLRQTQTSDAGACCPPEHGK